ncbi:hypothetical protein EW026_g7810 [Hermanssonia centrifuga]|uniref:Uncharacterized protein n=1 Tax=Hermanssonia centrifuga TaxID=98765 RepID=A0A4S4K6L2_9APHY|nr:hypothetical protein EW026_g7810 [Hermanssonia centrifuga]
MSSSDNEYESLYDQLLAFSECSARLHDEGGRSTKTTHISKATLSVVAKSPLMWLRAPPEEPSSDRFTTMQALYKNEMKNLPKSRRIIFLDCTSDPALNFQNEPDLISKLLIFSLGSRQPVVVAVEELLKSKLANNPERLWLPEDHPLYHSPPPLHITGLGVDSHMDAAAEGRSRSDITVDLSNVSFTQSPGYSYRPTTHQSSTEGVYEKSTFSLVV